MKKRLTTVVLIIISAVMFLSACQFAAPNIDWNADKANFIVYGNGTAAVQQGRYLYFLHGFRPASYADGRRNSWGDVDKGGIYRTTLLGREYTADDFQGYLADFAPQGRDWKIETDEDTRFDFVTTPVSVASRDDDFVATANPIQQPFNGFKPFGDFRDELVTMEGEEYGYVDVVKAELLIPMVGSTADREHSGLWIFGEFIYYTSPHTGIDRNGHVLFGQTAFWRTRLDGTGTTRIFVSGQTGPVPFGFYYMRGNTRANDRVYLVLHETYGDKNDIVSVGMNANGRGSINQMTLIQNVTSVIFPRRSTFVIGDHSVFAEDYIYFTRDIIPVQDNLWSGNVAERVRPNGTSIVAETGATMVGSEVISRTGQTITLDSVRNNVLFFRRQNGQNTELHFDNFKTGAEAVFSPNNAPLLRSIPSGATIFAFRDTDCAGSNRAHALIADMGELRLVSGSYSRVLYRGSVNIEFYDGREFVYFTTVDSNELRRVSINANAEGGDRSQLLSGEPVMTNFLRVTVTAGHIIYFRNIDNYARDYAFFKRATSNPNEREFWVGVRTANDFPEEEDEDDTEEFFD